MVVFQTNTKECKLQKNRVFKKPKKLKFSFGDCVIINLKEGRLELVQLSKIKKFLKKLIHKKKNNLNFKREKLWYLGRINFFLQKKPKNARMGKGKGFMFRKIIRLQKNFVIFEFKGMNFYKIKWFLFKLNKISSLRFNYLFKRTDFYSIWFKPASYLLFYNKYLFI